MAKRSKHTFIKLEKEIKRKKKAKEKIARRQGKNDAAAESDNRDSFDTDSPEED